MPAKLLALFFLFLTISFPVFADGGKVEPIGAFADPSASEALKKALEPKGYRVSLADGSVLCEIWLPSAIVSGKTEAQGAVYTWLAESALVALAQNMSGELLKNVLEVKVAPITMQVSNMEMGHNAMHDATTSLRAGKIVGVETRAIGGNDHLCGNENVYYAPLAKLVHSMPAVAELDEYDGPGLGVIWTLHGKRSAFVGRFAL